MSAATWLRRGGPFANLAHPRRVWAWGMFDLANQSFTLLINTLLFSVFFQQLVAQPAVEASPALQSALGRLNIDPTSGGSFLWGLTVSISLLIVVIAGPVVGAAADARAIKKPLLTTSAIFCVALTAGLALAPEGDTGIAALAIAAALYIPANIAFNLGENLLAGFLPELCERKNIGRVSAIGWTMGYIGALALLILTAGAVAFFNLETEQSWRPLFVFAALWFLLMAIPTFLFLPEQAQPAPDIPSRTLVGEGFRRVATSIRHAAEYRDISTFLVSFFVYAFGVQAVIFFAGIIARADFGFTTGKLVAFTAVVTVTAGIGAAAVGFIQDRLGHRNTVGLFLLVWIATALGLAWLVNANQLHAAGATDTPPPEWGVWVVGNFIGLGLGGIGTASRAMVGYCTPRHRTAEFFGLWGLAYKGAGCIGAVGFGLIRDAFGSVTSLLALAAVFALGAAGVAFVNERRGARMADNAEAEEARRRAAPAHSHEGPAPHGF